MKFEGVSCSDVEQAVAPRSDLTLLPETDELMKHTAASIVTLLVSCSAISDSPIPPSTTTDFSTSCSRLAAIGEASQALLWYRTATELKAIYLETFHAASRRLSELEAEHPGRTWVVISDADETLLDNSPYKCESELRGDTAFNAALWDEWVSVANAVATPGAAEFVRDVHALGGKLVVVSNRDDAKHRLATDKNFRALGITVDQYALKADKSDKNPRFDQITRNAGVGADKPPELRIFLGDNIQDFPGTTQSTGDIGAEFGRRFFVFPNPTYGSWQTNAFK